jgi:hypothetical protein
MPDDSKNKTDAARSAHESREIEDLLLTTTTKLVESEPSSATDVISTSGTGNSTPSQPTTQRSTLLQSLLDMGLATTRCPSVWWSPTRRHPDRCLCPE